MKKALTIIFLLSLSLPFFSFAQESEIIPDIVSTVKAQVVTVEKSETKTVPGTDVTSIYQSITAKILEGKKEGEVISINNDYLSLQKGEIFYLQITIRGADGAELYAVSDPYRIPTLIFFTLLFIFLVIIFGGIQGIRGLLSLCGSLILILYVLIPGILAGYSPIWVSLFAATLIIIIGSYITHGFNKTTTSAVLGMICTVIFTGILAYIAVHSARLSGFANEESVYLNMDTRGSIDFVGLLLGGILIGLLGVLYDVAIGQAISVEELHAIAPHVPRLTIYKRAIRIGREHIGALVNILAIAYVGVSLPLILLYAKSAHAPIEMILNKELFSTEIIRTMVGGIGLILAVPITTLISAWFLVKSNTGIDDTIIKKEEEKINHITHTHGN